MNFHRYLSVDVLNGVGTRCTLFLSGCEHRCPHCYNASTWGVHSGQRFQETHLSRILSDLTDTRIPRRGLSLTGGDPLLPANCHQILKLVQQVKTLCPEKDIWCWTGYTLETLTPDQQKILSYLDTLIDGRFVQELADPQLRFRGSSNQRILGKEDLRPFLLQ